MLCLSKKVGAFQGRLADRRPRKAIVLTVLTDVREPELQADTSNVSGCRNLEPFTVAVLQERVRLVCVVPDVPFRFRLVGE